MNKLKSLLKQKAKITDAITGLRKKDAQEKAKRHAKAKNLLTKDRRKIVRRVLNGESIIEVAKSINRAPMSVNQKVQHECRQANLEIYNAGILIDSTNNYRTPPLKYLRENKRLFGF